MTTLKICHISSVHPADDVRIFHKECCSLSKVVGWQVFFVGNGPLDPKNSGVQFIDIGRGQWKSRLVRMATRGYAAYKLALELNCNIYHIHDPELLPWALLLKYKGRTVIYDSHEDMPRDLLDKAWIPKVLRTRLSVLAEAVENFIASRLDAVVAATPFIRDRFIRARIRSYDINNYPLLGELSSKTDVEAVNNTANVCYTGAITKERGAYEMLAAAKLANIKLTIAGSYTPRVLRDDLVKQPGWCHVDERGQVTRDELCSIFSHSKAGLVLFHPVANNVNAQPNKLFEYMSAGLPVIASDFPLWKAVIEEVGCGICVNPIDANAIAKAMNWVEDHPIECREMGERGAKAVREMYNWEQESEKLVALYRSLV